MIEGLCGAGVDREAAMGRSLWEIFAIPQNKVKPQIDDIDLKDLPLLSLVLNKL